MRCLCYLGAGLPSAAICVGWLASLAGWLDLQLDGFDPTFGGAGDTSNRTFDDGNPELARSR